MTEDVALPEPGIVRWPGNKDIMEVWVQTALDDPRVGDEFHELYSYFVYVDRVTDSDVSWHDSVGMRDTYSRDLWKQRFRYDAAHMDGKHWIHLGRRGERPAQESEAS